MPITADVPGSSPGSNLTQQEWNDSILPAVYERQWFLPRTMKMKRGYNRLNVPEMGVVSGHTMASTSDGTDIFLDSMNPTSVPLNPNWLEAGHAYPDSLEWRSVEGIPAAAARNAENGLAAYIEQQYLTDVIAGTNFLGGAAYDSDAAGIRAAVAQLRTSALTEAMPGDTEIFGLFYSLQHDDLMSVPEFTHADQRGDGANPLVSGMFGKGNGVTFQLSTLNASDPNGRHNPIWVRSAFGYYWNETPNGEKQRYLAQNRVFAQCDIAHGILFPARFVNVRTKTS